MLMRMELCAEFSTWACSPEQCEQCRSPYLGKDPNQRFHTWLHNPERAPWFMKKWGLVRHSAALAKFAWRFDPGYAPIISVALRDNITVHWPTDVQKPENIETREEVGCIAVHVRHGDACNASKFKLRRGRRVRRHA